MSQQEQLLNQQHDKQRQTTAEQEGLRHAHADPTNTKDVDFQREFSESDAPEWIKDIVGPHASKEAVNAFLDDQQIREQVLLGRCSHEILDASFAPDSAQREIVPRSFTVIEPREVAVVDPDTGEQQRDQDGNPITRIETGPVSYAGEEITIEQLRQYAFSWGSQESLTADEQESIAEFFLGTKPLRLSRSKDGTQLIRTLEQTARSITEQDKSESDKKGGLLGRFF